MLKNGLIEAVGADVTAPPDAVVIDGAGMTVYPGLIDMGNPAGTDITINLAQAQQGSRNTDEAERAKRTLILRPQVMAAEHVRLDAPELSRLAAGGVTSVLATPPGILVKGQSALVNVTTPEFAPIVGAVVEPRAGLSVVRSPVALHVELTRVGGDGFPAALLGGIAFVRQSFIDAQYQQLFNSDTRKGRPVSPGHRSTRRSTRCSRRSRDGCRSRSRPGCSAKCFAPSTWRRSSSSRRSSPAASRRTWRPRS